LENLSAQLQTLFIGGPYPEIFPEYSLEWERLKLRRGELPPPLPERKKPENQTPEDQAPSNDPSDSFNRTFFPGHSENRLRDEFDRSILNHNFEEQIPE
jgi:hypothetical protein